MSKKLQEGFSSDPVLAQNGITPKFQEIMNQHGATYKYLAAPYGSNGFQIFFPGDLDLSGLTLDDIPENLNVMGSLTISDRQFFMLEHGHYDIGGDIIVVGPRANHAIPVNADKAGYLEERLMSGQFSVYIGGEVRRVLDQK